MPENGGDGRPRAPAQPACAVWVMPAAVARRRVRPRNRRGTEAKCAGHRWKADRARRRDPRGRRRVRASRAR